MNIASEIVLAMLRVHPARTVSRGELAQLAQCSERDVRSAISELRRAGWLIVGDATGYRIAQSVEEVHQVVRALTSQIKSLQEVVEAMQVAASVRFAVDEARINEREMWRGPRPC
jgi:biotin operon repressor